jgi:hypothetical protein
MPRLEEEDTLHAFFSASSASFRLVLLAICITLSVRISTYPEQADYIRCEKHMYIYTAKP